VSAQSVFHVAIMNTKGDMNDTITPMPRLSESRNESGIEAKSKAV